ncbi:MAG: cation transporter [Elusimicrobia bacterium]|nr:cation transporter [Elusimicrobiota bacterium]
MKQHEHNLINTHSKSLLGFSLALTGATFFAELFGGMWANSVALVSDAGHMFMDLTALLFSLIAVKLAERPITDRRTFGLHRLEVFAAFLNGALVTAVAAWIVFESLQRLKTLPAVKTGPMLAIAFVGLAINLVVAWRLHDFAKKDMNIRGAFLHVASDALASIGVVTGGVLIHFTGAVVVDPLIGLFVAGIIVINAFRLLKDSIHILLEGVPKHIDLNDVIGAIRSVSGVDSVEDTHVWTICSHICTLSTHISVHAEKMSDQQKILRDINEVLRARFEISHSTIQIHSAGWKIAESASPIA